MTRRLTITFALLVLTVAACSSGTATEVRPFEEVQATEFVFEADPANPERGIFRMETTEPMICAIVWGETEALGNFNNSLAMNGTGITSHDVFLPGARPGVEYHFKVQGSTADGTLYESDLMTFTIPEIESAGSTDDVTIDHGINIALAGTVVETSSEFSAPWGGANVIDDDLSTEWATSGDGDDAFVVIDLGGTKTVSGVEFITRSMADGTSITNEFTVTVDDGETFGPFPAGNVADPGFAAVVTTGQVFRFEVSTSTGGNTGAVEIRIFDSEA
jgi:hypothetical protein